MGSCVQLIAGIFIVSDGKAKLVEEVHPKNYIVAASFIAHTPGVHQ